MERLQSVAVDLSRILETEITEEDWRRYNKGEKGVFVRKMLGFREKARLLSIADKYQSDGDFRTYVGRYLSEFARMLEDAKLRDPDGILRATMLSSDLGKVYMILARALGRDV